MAGQTTKSRSAAHNNAADFPQFKFSKFSEECIRQCLESELLRGEVVISSNPHRHGLRHDRTTSGLDVVAQRTLSEIVRAQRVNVESAARLVRGESLEDPRPNKAMHPQAVVSLLDGYEHRDLVVSIIERGIEPKWLRAPQRSQPVKNYKSFQKHILAAVRSIRDGQNQRRYMIVDDDLLEQWPNVVCSPLGAVEKKNTDPAVEVRIIHDLSFPENISANSSFDKSSAPEIRYHYIITIADRIEDLFMRYAQCVIRILKVDVKGAYRHLMVASQHVHWMAARIPEEKALLIDLSAPFRWSGSPPFYGAFGRAITWIVQQNSPSTVSPSEDSEPFWGFEWVDDHLLIKVDMSDRLQLADTTLRHAMLAILGPRAINEEKFSQWETRLNALGLTWDTVNRTVSIPDDKIAKALDRVLKLKHSRTVTKSDLMKLLGSLRHICSCLRTTRPFYQRLQSACNRAPRHGAVKLAASAQTDLEWFEHILTVGHLQELPLSILGSREPPAQVHLYMDASNMGLAVLNPSVNEFIQVSFDPEEKPWIDSDTKSNKFSINVREHLCIALALWIWEPT